MARPAARTVLVVDFDEAVRAECRAMLRSEGFMVYTGATNADIGQLLDEHIPDLLIVGVFLADGPGYEVFKDARIDSVPVVGLTDVFQGPTMRQLLKDRHPFLELLDKPLSGANLIDLMRVHFGAHYPDPPRYRAASEEGGDRDPQPQQVSGAYPIDQLLLGSDDKDSGLRPFPRMRTSPQHRPLTMHEVPSHLDWRAVGEQGDLGSTSFAALIAQMINTRYSGSLRLWRERVRKILYFDDGQLVAVRSNLLYECLGAHLVRDHVISEEINEESIARAQAEGLRQGEVLVDMGMIDEDALTVALRQQIEERVLDVFGWTDGRFRTHGQAVLPRVTAMSRADVSRLVVRGVMSRVPHGRIIRELDSCFPLRIKLGRSIEEMESLGFSEHHRDVIEDLLSGGSLLELVARHEQTAEVYHVVYALVVLGAVTLQL